MVLCCTNALILGKRDRGRGGSAERRVQSPEFRDQSAEMRTRRREPPRRGLGSRTHCPTGAAEANAEARRKSGLPNSLRTRRESGPVTGLAPRGISDRRFQIVDWRSRRREASSSRSETLLSHSGRWGVDWQGWRAAPELKPDRREGWGETPPAPRTARGAAAGTAPTSWGRWSPPACRIP